MQEIKRGLLPVYAEKSAVNTIASAEEAASIAQLYNQSDYLEREFFQRSEKVLWIQELASGGKVSVVIPSGPYTDLSTMVIAHGPHSFDQPAAQTEFVYDYPLDVQETYWAVIIKSISFLSCLPYQGRRHVIATENAIKTYTNASMRTSRSVCLPHSMINYLEEDCVAAEEWQISHLRKEETLLQNPKLMSGYLGLLQEAYHRLTGCTFVDLSARDQAPFGYQFNLAPVHLVPQITQILANHHHAYSVAAEQTTRFLLEAGYHFLARHLIPQPSYRLFLSLQAGQVEAVICPEFRSHAGVMEALGVRLHRSPDNQRRKSPSELHQFFGQLAQYLGREMA